MFKVNYIDTRMTALTNVGTRKHLHFSSYFRVYNYIKILTKRPIKKREDVIVSTDLRLNF